MKLELWETIQPFVIEYGPPRSVMGELHFCMAAKSLQAERKEVRFEFHKNGNLASCMYLVEGLCDRPIQEGPAFEAFTENGSRTTIEFWVRGSFVESRSRSK